MSDNQETVTISKRQFNNLIEARDELRALYAAGVDNWEGYDAVMRQLDGEDDKE